MLQTLSPMRLDPRDLAGTMIKRISFFMKCLLRIILGATGAFIIAGRGWLQELNTPVGAGRANRGLSPEDED